MSAWDPRLCVAGGGALTGRQAALPTLEAAVPACVGLAVRGVERPGHRVPGIARVRVGQAGEPHLAGRVPSHGRELPARGLLDGRRPTGPLQGHVVIAEGGWALSRDVLLVPREYLTRLQRCYGVSHPPAVRSGSSAFPTCSLAHVAENGPACLRCHCLPVLTWQQSCLSLAPLMTAGVRRGREGPSL